MGKDFLHIYDLTRQEIYKVFDLARSYKAGGRQNAVSSLLKGRSIGLLFNKPSTRTRVSFEVAVYNLGGNTVYLQGEATQISRGESIKDTADVLSRYLDGIIVRTYRQEDVEEFARRFQYPVINALTDMLHPCQALADFFTIYEIKGTLEGVRVTYFGDGNNVCNSLILGADIFGVKLRVVTPAKYGPDETILKMVKHPALIELSNDPHCCIEGSDVIYTDTWVSMGEESSASEKNLLFSDYQVNAGLMGRAKEDAIFMHCLPAHRGSEVTDEVLDSSSSVVLQQAENRLHCQKALIHLLYSGL